MGSNHHKHFLTTCGIPLVLGEESKQVEKGEDYVQSVIVILNLQTIVNIAVGYDCV